MVSGKIAIIGDVHSRPNWLKINLDTYDRVIFMGDYFDPYGFVGFGDRWEIFKKVQDLKQKNPDKTVLLFGNHDQHYTGECSMGSSRHDGMFARHFDLDKVFHDLLNDGTLQIAYHVPGTDILCTHAGLSKNWYKQHIGTEFTNLDELEVSLNACKDRLQVFDFADVSWDIYGFSPEQGPLWWRCTNEYNLGLQESNMLEGFTQVMGHTQVRNLIDIKGKGLNVRGVFVDGLGSDWYTELTINEDGTYKFKQMNIV